MKVSDFLESRQTQWRELEQLCTKMEGGSRRKVEPLAAVRLSSLYRSACADLALAGAYQIPPETTEYLHRLVGRAHNQLYRSRSFNMATWGRELLGDVPQRLFSDNYLRLAFFVFWGIFVLCMTMAYRVPGFAEQIVSHDVIMQMEEMYSQPVQGSGPGLGGGMAGYYVLHNAGIGLRCFAYGILFGVGGLYVTLYNAAVIGSIFGYMATTPQSDNFFHFVTAHGPFELTAVVLSAAAGMRMGFSLVDTGGLERMASLRRAAERSVPTISAAVILFAMAAVIETFLSPSAAPYWIKAVVSVVSAGLLTFYFVVLGYPRGE
ncbi:MAG: stage II sporulation protein M [Pirellulales bacterium]|nr:stage II sporulation protein M [Pirellulales bacterium]